MRGDAPETTPPPPTHPAQKTDVLLGMHGAGWTNALFAKHGVTGLQVRGCGGPLRVTPRRLPRRVHGWVHAALSTSPLLAQLHPYGFLRPDGETIRGGNLGNLVKIGAGRYLSWVNPRSDCSFVHDSKGVVMPARCAIEWAKGMRRRLWHTSSDKCVCTIPARGTPGNCCSCPSRARAED